MPRARLALAAVLGFAAGTSLIAIEHPIPAATAQPRALTLDGSCDRGDVLVFNGGDRARCVDLDELFPRCDAGEFLSTPSGELRCLGGSTTPWDARGLLPECSTNAIVVSEGFGRWRCEDRR